MIAAINQAMDLKAWIEVLLSTVLTGSTLYVAWKQYGNWACEVKNLRRISEAVILYAAR